MDSKYKQFEKIYKLYVKAIFRFAYLKVSDNDLAQDITQDTFIRFWRVLSDGEEIKNHKAFLYFIAHGLVVDYYRKKKNKVQISLDKVDGQLVDIDDELEKKMDMEVQLDGIRSKLREIKKEYRDILLLHYVEDLDIPEIAFILKKKENTVRVQIYRALKALKGKL